MKHTEQDKLIRLYEVAIYDLKTENNRLKKELAALREDKHAEQDQPLFVNADRQDDTSLEDLAFVEDYYNRQALDYGWSDGKEEA